MTVSTEVGRIVDVWIAVLTERGQPLPPVAIGRGVTHTIPAAVRGDRSHRTPNQKGVV